MQTSDKASNINHIWSGIRIRISGLIGIRIQTSAGSLPKCYGLTTMSTSIILLRVVKTVRCEMLINLLKSAIPQRWGKWKSDPEFVSGTGSPPKVNQFFCLLCPSFNEIGRLLLHQLLHKETNSTDSIISASANVITTYSDNTRTNLIVFIASFNMLTPLLLQKWQCNTTQNALHPFKSWLA